MSEERFTAEQQFGNWTLAAAVIARSGSLTKNGGIGIALHS
jgi:hypothetical protein